MAGPQAPGGKPGHTAPLARFTGPLGTKFSGPPQPPHGWAQGTTFPTDTGQGEVRPETLYLNTDLTCNMSSGPMPSPGIMVTVCRPPYLADGGWKGGGEGGPSVPFLPPALTQWAGQLRGASSGYLTPTPHPMPSQTGLLTGAPWSEGWQQKQFPPPPGLGSIPKQLKAPNLTGR